MDGVAPDAIENEKTGLICDGNNLDDIYSSLSSMLNSVNIEYGQNAKSNSEKLSFWSKYIEKF